MLIVHSMAEIIIPLSAPVFLCASSQDKNHPGLSQVQDEQYSYPGPELGEEKGPNHDDRL